jgi:hypothetical protein
MREWFTISFTTSSTPTAGTEPRTPPDHADADE